MQERQKAPIKIMYGIGQLMNLVWDKHPEYDKEAVLKELAVDYLSAPIFAEDSNTVILNLNDAIEDLYLHDEECAAEVLYDLILKAAAVTSYDPKTAYRMLFTPAFRIEVSIKNMESEKIISILKDEIKNNFIKDIKTYDHRIYGVFSDSAMPYPNQIPEAFAGLVLKKKINEDGTKMLEIEHSCFADEIDTYRILESIGSISNNKDFIDFCGLRLFRKYDAVYHQADCRCMLYDFIHNSADKYNKHSPASDVLGALLLVIKGDKRGDILGSELRGLKRDMTTVCRATQRDMLYLAAVLAAEHSIFNGIRICGQSPKEFMESYENEDVLQNYTAGYYKPDCVAVYENGVVKKYVEPSVSEPETELCPR